MWAEWRGARAYAEASSRERDGSVTGGGRRATRGSRSCAGSVTEVRRRSEVRRFPNGQESAWFEILPWGAFRTTQALPWLETPVWRGFPTTQIPDRSNPTFFLASLARDDHESPTPCRPCARCFTNPSRPGRLVGSPGGCFTWRRGRGRRGREGVPGPLPGPDLVTESVRTPRFPSSSSTVKDLRVVSGRSQRPKSTRVQPFALCHPEGDKGRRVQLRAIGGVMEVRLPHEPVPASPRTPHVLGVAWR
jgi:hypothetical protein